MVSSKIEIRENVPLADATTFGVGGPARYFVRVSSGKDAELALTFAVEQGLDTIVLGGGSNVLFSDEGFPGLVILNRIRGITFEEMGGEVIVTAGGGEDWQDFTDLCVEKGWQGVDCLAGIPGTVGACPIQNVGAYGQEVSQVISRVRCLEMSTGKAVTFDNEECAFRYRQSIFNTDEAGKYFVSSVTFKLANGGTPAVKYRELEDRISGISSPTLADVRDTVLSIREGKGLLVRNGYESFKSAGSFFKNPILNRAQFEHVETIVDSYGGGKNWAWPSPDGEIKISAACLIQCSGFGKGYQKGNVGISPHHTLILINRGGASAREIVEFAAEVQQRVLDRFGVLLQPEARLTGFSSSPLIGLPIYDKG
ncbi:MAG TPA: UDP-N-acetylmuramate dehydrogenase [Geobacteraceae bacterium]|nr:UDP-N-acetylmuramate dehydrogenase [Geobacteraceae bacterium]